MFWWNLIRPDWIPHQVWLKTSSDLIGLTITSVEISTRSPEYHTNRSILIRTCNSYRSKSIGTSSKKFDTLFDHFSKLLYRLLRSRLVQHCLKFVYTSQLSTPLHPRPLHPILKITIFQNEVTGQILLVMFSNNETGLTYKMAAVWLLSPFTFTLITRKQYLLVESNLRRKVSLPKTLQVNFPLPQN